MSVSLFSQIVVGKPWAIECGASSNNAFQRSSSLNLRYISPRFRWSDDELTEEEEKHPEKFKNTRLMIEVIYTPPFKVLCTGFNVQSRFLKYRRLSVELYGGVKFFFVPGPDFEAIPFLKAGRQIWYMNVGLLCQLNLGMIAPFADIGGDGIITVGTEVNLHAIYKKPKKRYKLHTRSTST